MSSEPLQILLVEDNPGDARLVRERLREAGAFTFELAHVSRLSEAKAWLASRRAHVVLLDLSLPDTSGLDSIIQADGFAPEVPILVLTGLHDENLAVEALKAGAQDYLIKGETDGAGMTRAIRYALERKRLEQEREQLLAGLEGQHARLQAVLRHIPSGLLLIEAPSGKVVMSNPEAERIFHRPLQPGHRATKPGPLAGYREDGRRMQPLEWPLARLLRGETVRSDEFQCERADGTRSWIRASGAPIRSAEGQITACVLTLEQIDEEKRAEQAERFLAEAGEVLASSLDYEETLESVGHLAVRSLADWCVIDIVEEDGQIRRLQVAHADPAMHELTEQLLHYPLDRTRPHLLASVLRTRQPMLVPEVTHEMLDAVVQSEEHRRILTGLALRSYIAVPLLARERLLGILLFVSSSRRYGEEDLRLAQELARRASLAVDDARLYKQAREALRARDEVLRVVSHDLRNPLSTITMSADLLLDPQLQLPREREIGQLQMIRRSAERMDRLIEDLLDVARIEAGRLALEKNYLEPIRIVREAVELNQSQAAAGGLILEGQASDDLPPVFADRDRVQQVLGNLIGNAIKFTPSGGHIEVQTEHQEEEVRFSVADTGPGIEPEHLPELFRPFWQARRRGREGAGLGLAISRGIIEAHGGKIWAESTSGVGTTLFFTLPVAAERRQCGDAP